MYIIYNYLKLAKYPPSRRRDFPRPAGEWCLRRPFGKRKQKKIGAPGAPRWGRQLTPPSAAIKIIGVPSVPQISGACGAPNGFKNVTRSMRIPNMCLVLKLDNGKVVSIANGQNHRTIQYGISI